MSIAKISIQLIIYISLTLELYQHGNIHKDKHWEAFRYPKTLQVIKLFFPVVKVKVRIESAVLTVGLEIGQDRAASWTSLHQITSLIKSGLYISDCLHHQKSSSSYIPQSGLSDKSEPQFSQITLEGSFRCPQTLHVIIFSPIYVFTLLV